MARCIYPVNLKSRGIVPCGKCPSCLQNYRSGWALRLYTESTFNAETYFLTLTYNTDSIPIVIKNDIINFSLNKKDIQDFFKKLRNIQPLRYYLCGEYGPQGDRPHYHALLFLKEKIKLLDLYLKIKRCWSTYNKKTKIVTSKGFITLDYAKPTDYQYVVKYLRKGQGNIDYKFSRELKGQLPDFALMSRKPALGDEVSAQTLLQYLSDKAPNLNGTAYLLPRRYKDFLKDIDPEAYEAFQLESKRYLPEEYISDEQYRNKILTKQKFLDTLR